MVLRSITFTTLYFVKKSRLVKLAVFLIIAIAFFSLSFRIVERPYQEQKELYSYWKDIESIVIFTISGFDTDSPHTPPGWVFALSSLIMGIVLVGAFTAEIASVFVESRLKKHSAVKNVDFKDHILICGTLTDVKNFISQLFHPDHGKANLQVVFLMPREPSGEMENITGVLNT